MSRQQRLTLVATILGSTVVFLDATVINVALPAIGDDLEAGLAGQQWVVEAYLLTMVSLMLVGARALQGIAGALLVPGSLAIVAARRAGIPTPSAASTGPGSGSRRPGSVARSSL